MGCNQSYFVADGIINELIDHFKILNSDHFSSFTVNSIKISSTFERKGIRDISNYIKNQISTFSFDTINDEEFFNIYIARKLMCQFLNFPFVEQLYQRFSEMDNERRYFDSVKIKPQFVSTMQSFKMEFFTDKEGHISPDTTDQQIIHELEDKLICIIGRLITVYGSYIFAMVIDAFESLDRQKQDKHQQKQLK